MRIISLAILFIATVALAYRLGPHHQTSQTEGIETKRHVLYYVDPMHPSYKSDKPGTAPDCGMQLEPVYAGKTENATPSSESTGHSGGAVSIDEATQQLVGIRLAMVEKSAGARTIRAVGRVLPEDTRVYAINSGVDGFIRETGGDSVGTVVAKDQKLAAYYAPDFIAAASGFLAANERVPGAVTNEGARSIQNYTDRLRNLGMSDLQIKRVAATRQLPENIDIITPVSGVILARNVSPGQHFGRDMTFYQIADLSRVWVEAEIYEQDAPYLHPGGPAQVILRDDGRRLPARIADSLPQSNLGSGTVELRLEVNNPRTILRPQMKVDVELPVRLTPAVTVPLDAVIDSGAHTRVYVEHGGGVFEPREVQTGQRTSDTVEILKGVQPGERVVAASTFLVDSESRLKAQAR